MFQQKLAGAFDTILDQIYNWYTSCQSSYLCLYQKLAVSYGKQCLSGWCQFEIDYLDIFQHAFPYSPFKETVVSTRAWILIPYFAGLMGMYCLKEQCYRNDSSLYLKLGAHLVYTRLDRYLQFFQKLLKLARVWLTSA